MYTLDADAVWIHLGSRHISCALEAPTQSVVVAIFVFCSLPMGTHETVVWKVLHAISLFFIKASFMLHAWYVVGMISALSNKS